MISARVASFLAKPAVKYGGIALGIAALVVIVVLYLDGVREDGKKAGASEVTTKVQTETIKQVEKAREDKVKADDAVREKPIDAVIDSLK